MAHNLLTSVKQLNIEERKQGNDTGGNKRCFRTNENIESEKLFEPSPYKELLCEIHFFYLHSHQMDWSPNKQLSESIETFRKGLLNLEPNWYNKISRSNHRYFVDKTSSFDLDLAVFLDKVTRNLRSLINLKRKEETKFDLILQDMIKKVADLVDVLVESIGSYFQLHPSKYPVDFKPAKDFITEIMNNQNPIKLEDVHMAPKPYARECSVAECGSLLLRSSAIPEVVEPSPNQPVRLTNHLQYIQKEVMKALLNHPKASFFLSFDDTPYNHLAALRNKERYPVNLTIIKQRLENNYYWDAKHCVNDFNKLFTYFYVFFQPGSDVVRNAQELEGLFLEMVKICFNEKEVVL